MAKNNRAIVRKIKTGSAEDTDNDGFIQGDPSYLFSIMWDITRDAWAFNGEADAERRLQRHITNFQRRKD